MCRVCTALSPWSALSINSALSVNHRTARRRFNPYGRTLQAGRRDPDRGSAPVQCRAGDGHGLNEQPQQKGETSWPAKKSQFADIAVAIASLPMQQPNGITITSNGSLQASMTKAITARTASPKHRLIGSKPEPLPAAQLLASVN